MSSPRPIKAALSPAVERPLSIETLILDPPQAGEVRLEVAAAAICHSDVFYIDGAWGEQPPTVYGHEVAGTVVEVGEGVDTVAPGDHAIVGLIRACGNCHFCRSGQPAICPTHFPIDETSRLHTPAGEPVAQGLDTAGFAEQVVVHHSQVVKVPAEIGLAEAALLACGVLTGWGAVTRSAQVPPGASVAVIGIGGVGLNAVQGAVLSEAGEVVAIDLAPPKLEVARDFGATAVALPDQAARVVAEVTEGRGADFVFVTAGSGRAIDLGMDLMRRGGALVVVGMPPNGVATTIELGYLAGAGQRIIGSKMGSGRPHVDVPELVELYLGDRLKLDELITGRYPLERINEAIDPVRRGEAIRNVIVF